MIPVDAVIWDYNGTLLDDVGNALKSINIMLGKRKMPLLNLKSYREVFAFPVKEYYKKIGFDFTVEDWFDVGSEFIELYNSFQHEYSIFPEAEKLIKTFSKQKKLQFILSSMEQGMLEKSVKKDGIFDYFKDISGIKDIYAGSKVENGKSLLINNGLSPENVCLLGDTVHDYDVSKELGCRCVLIASGHQSFSKLKDTGLNKIVNSCEEILNWNI